MEEAEDYLTNHVGDVYGFYNLVFTYLEDSHPILCEYFHEQTDPDDLRVPEYVSFFKIIDRIEEYFPNELFEPAWELP